ncbi:hypothetical protein AUEXF2481DRAFT_26962 [Aureobasidium subglaciale EXF-2481]|uniref:Glycosyltransferase family 25 protein n=1 Tax=Aureobasidium subglaciale (strain EXF-2481) TaxID=1043005 RepID=A0A074ZJC5_AURSE|nr:uncharacterized protein AUEXF2481DRAFT_26962 [Aureobasidium subglaciale EXF-2481]KEQ98601.1 hypothetical protein AUEXF2481DRAFT_26962 [Aureobasidium subglaciale EXF-2481]
MYTFILDIATTASRRFRTRIQYRCIKIRIERARTSEEAMCRNTFCSEERDNISTLLEGLSEQERNDIHFAVFIAQTDPSVHFAYHEDWLHNLADEVLLYDLPKKKMEHVIELEKTGNSREKGLFDYTYMLKSCYEQGAEHIAMFEDDIVALDGWYHRAVAGLELAERQSTLQKASMDCKLIQYPPSSTTKTNDPKVLYLRLFYTEEFLGWNSEEWRTYLSYSLLATAVLTIALILLRCISRTAKKSMTPSLVLPIYAICLPLTILLFFAAGRTTVLSLPTGVNEMPRYGCCSQALVFPRSSALSIINLFQDKKLGFVDSLIEEFADQNGGLRWALTPSVVQHIGRKSSKGDDFGTASKYSMSVAEKLWNFGFEENDGEELRREHLEVIGKGIPPP